MASFDIVVRTRISLHTDDEPSQFVTSYSGVITCTDDETGATTPVGRVSALRVHASLAMAAGVSLFDVCDAHSQELHILHTLLYDPDRYHFRDDLVHRFQTVGSDLLILDYVVLAPKWRRLKLGLLAVRKLVDHCSGGCGMAVSLIAPLRPDAHDLLRVPGSWLPRQADRQARKEAVVTLRRYFRRMGFVRLGRTPYYALPLNRKTPTAEDLLGGPGSSTG